MQRFCQQCPSPDWLAPHQTTVWEKLNKRTGRLADAKLYEYNYREPKVRLENVVVTMAGKCFPGVSVRILTSNSNEYWD